MWSTTFDSGLKAMLHEAIFLATCNVTMTNKKPFKLQKRCHTFATFFATCNAYNNKQDGGRLAHSDKIALQVAKGMLHVSNLYRNVAKSRGSFYFSCNSQRSNCSCKMGCYTWIFSCNLQRNVRLLHCKLQEKLLRATWPLVLQDFEVCLSAEQAKVVKSDNGLQSTFLFGFTLLSFCRLYRDVSIANIIDGLEYIYFGKSSPLPTSMCSNQNIDHVVGNRHYQTPGLI